MGKYDFELNLEEENTISIMNTWIAPGMRVLEFGPANGRMTKYLKEEKQCDVTIVEIDEVAGKQAAAYATESYLGTQMGDAEQYHWCADGKQYDCIVFADVLEHLKNPQEVLRKCEHVLAPQGEILISIPNIAHNSVLIDLWNDQFAYQETGLLDATHVHFFTYHSFFDMLSKLSYVIADQRAIYSHVGWNELHNSYDSVDGSLENALRKRESGIVYQYVFKLGRKTEYDKSLCWEDLAVNTDAARMEEASCYVQAEQAVQADSRVACTYESDGNRIEINFEMQSDGNVFRIDPMEANCILLLEACQIEEITDTNAAFQAGNLYFFTDNDPWFMVLTKDKTRKVQVAFTVLESHMDEQSLSRYEKLMQQMGQGQSLFNRRAFESERKEQNAYISHLETDIQTQKAYIEQLESNAQVRRTYIEQLESEGTKQRDYIAHLEQDVQEQKAYIDHLEGDIAELQGYIAHLEQDITAQKDYISHLEKDIQELKAYIEHNSK